MADGRARLSPSHSTTQRTRRFARRSALGSLTLGMAGQVAFHLLTQAHAARAPWPVITAVACLPVLILGMGAALAHLLRADARQPVSVTHGSAAIQARTSQDRSPDPDRLAHARAAAAQLADAGHRISRRNLRAAGVKGSNATHGTLAYTLRATAPTGSAMPGQRRARDPSG